MSTFQIFLDDYNYNNTKQWLIDHESALLKSVALYVFGIFAAKYVMRDRKPFDLVSKLLNFEPKKTNKIPFYEWKISSFFLLHNPIF